MISVESLWCTILTYAKLNSTKLNQTKLIHTILYYTILYYTILYYTILYYTVLYCTVLYYKVLYYTLICYTRGFTSPSSSVLLPPPAPGATCSATDRVCKAARSLWHNCGGHYENHAAIMTRRDATRRGTARRDDYYNVLLMTPTLQSTVETRVHTVIIWHMRYHIRISRISHN